MAILAIFFGDVSFEGVFHIIFPIEPIEGSLMPTDLLVNMIMLMVVAFQNMMTLMMANSKG